MFFPPIVIIIKTKVLLPQADVILTSFGFPIFRLWAYQMNAIPKTRYALN